MNEVWEFFQKLFDTADFPPRWHCGFWTQFHGWLYIISDLAIWAAYFVIPVIILRYISRKTSAKFVRIYFLFASFILACGATHFFDALAFWLPVYRFNALLLFLTAVISWVTVFSLVRLLPTAFESRTSGELEAEIVHRKAVEAQLQVNNNLLMEAQEIARLGHWQWDVAVNKVVWSPMTLKLFGMAEESPEMSYEQYLETLHPEDARHVQHMIALAFKNKVFPKFYHRIILPDGRVRTMLSRGEVILGADNEVVKMIGTVQDITDQKNTEMELMIKTQKLEASNAELQKFASVASHDLREPLRKIITFGSMLDKEFSDELGVKGKMYLQKITGASARMQKLIDSILDFSRLTINGSAFEKVKLNEILVHVLSDMEVAIEKSGAAITIAPLPEIDGNVSQLGQLFQNLISNAIKFGKPGIPPSIDISGEIITTEHLPEGYPGNTNLRLALIKDAEQYEHQRYCKILVSDNGIGFDEAYLDRIFLIFQRLHDNSEFEGTGIGLAVVKKVVDLHNGYITASSGQGKGTTFMVILPVTQEQFGVE